MTKEQETELFEIIDDYSGACQSGPWRKIDELHKDIVEFVDNLVDVAVGASVPYDSNQGL
jgi:hypothetical protein